MEHQDESFHLQLRKAVYHDDWNSVSKIFEEHPEYRINPINNELETLLMLAVGTNRSHRFVQRLVSDLSKDGLIDQALAAQNDQGNTVLHYAITVGNVIDFTLLMSISSDPAKIAYCPNKYGRTPLVFASYQGKKNKMLEVLFSRIGVLSPLISGIPEQSLRSGALLDLAIEGEFIDIALKLVMKHPDIILSGGGRNIQRALNKLAMNPKIFRSGSGLGFFGRLIYSLLPVQEIKIELHAKEIKIEADEKGIKIESDEETTSQRCAKDKNTITSHFFKRISDNQKHSLEAPFSEQEVKSAVWSCGYNKAPGPDGFTFEFVRKFWDMVGKDFYEAVKYFESNHRIHPGSNSSFITLVPKVSDPLSLDDYRPINLIGCVNKVISKVLAERLKGVLDSVISNSQTAFIKGRSILDGPLMVNELINWAKKKKKKLLIFKVDFAKAFDTLNWNYLDNVLMQMGFGQKWREWMKGCTRTAKVSVLVNGSPTKEFSLGKGVRQGDPLAPFLFILAAEGLTVAMKEAQRSNLFKGIRIGNSIDELSIFQFADDAIFVGEWDKDNAMNLIRILKCFEVCSGLKINMGKSRLLGVSVSKEEVTSLARRLKCKEDSIPFRYLGLPVGGNMKLARNWQPLIDKCRSKLSGWKAKTLSIGGRLCLCKSVLGTLGTYFFSLYKAPKKVLSSLESLRCRFFWGSTEDCKKICWTAWDKVIRDKKCGGLGIGSLRALNLAMLVKWKWRERTEPDAKWRTVVRNCNLNYSADGVTRSRCGVWNSIIGTEKDLRDMGINLSSLMQHKADGGGWSWELESSKNYTVSSLRKLIDGVSLPIADLQTEWIRWIPSKTNVLLWRILTNRLATKDNLQNRGVIMPSTECPLCLSSSECLDHLMATCSTTKLISAHLTNWVDWWPGGEHTVEAIWSKIRTIGKNKVHNEVCKVIGAAYFTSIWAQRNGMVFKRGVKNEKEICRDIQFLAFDWESIYTTAKKFYHRNCTSMAWFKRILQYIASPIMNIYDMKVTNTQATQLVRCLCSSVIKARNNRFTLAVFRSTMINAVHFEILEVIEEIIHASPSITGSILDGNDAFQEAIRLRHIRLYNHLYQMPRYRMLIANCRDEQTNENVLHIVAKSFPSHLLTNNMGGAALHMQHELLWFKEIETNLIDPALKELENAYSKTARQVFTEVHEDLVKEGEKWMKDTSSSFTLVVALIVTVAFAAAFTVPGGNKSEGKPVYLDNGVFMLFIISDAIALFSSVTSLLMFLGIMTSRYAEEDFLYTLPKRLTIGLISLFISLASMIVAFSATLSVVLQDKVKWIAAPLLTIACIPVGTFVRLQFPLLTKLIQSTYFPSLFHKQNNRMFH
ncbi:hypothetical protein OSB04_010178 [Centaurea solstitialis]|uniref:Reverse transcriptase domain-containing protein n=1 Tax=Centaurea solstitialis TaxID=347529 RepID=A0AA38T8Q9_9ASTR|nr:hypothetical protein OSB04_010178 [Centaurea solstitialis]